ncbi:hypothetical protein PGTUg99_027519 [Puccinia graminis f. sp. tritici]|uniref:Uncharacterized protein n=1 Tax=Puccinia graminis f. sp. tritici TaxID=56615 RepID=A0A5B0NJ10_PUCGR|nr:hypothetical protein PGTUg99_027519 [Puccinia graminis f. sp. tritici]
MDDAQAKPITNPQSKKQELLIIINRFSKMSQGRSSEGMQWVQNPAKSWPGSRIIATCRSVGPERWHRSVGTERWHQSVGTERGSSQPSQTGASSFPSGARSQIAHQRPRKANQSLFTGPRRQALLQRCVIALSTFCRSPHESTHVDVSPAKGRQDVV